MEDALRELFISTTFKTSSLLCFKIEAKAEFEM